MIKTDRLVLRKFVILDKYFLFKLNNDKEVNKFRSSDSRPLNKCEDDIIKWNKKYNDDFLNVYLIASKTDDRPLGMMFLVDIGNNNVELGYRLLKEEWKKGYCKESAKKIIELFFAQSNNGKVYAETHNDNINSINFLVNFGFQEEKQLGENGGRLFILNETDYNNNCSKIL